MRFILTRGPSDEGKVYKQYFSPPPEGDQDAFACSLKQSSVALRRNTKTIMTWMTENLNKRVA